MGKMLPLSISSSIHKKAQDRKLQGYKHLHLYERSSLPIDKCPKFMMTAQWSSKPEHANFF